MRPSGPISVSASYSSNTTITSGGRRSFTRSPAPAPSWPIATAATAAPTSKRPTTAVRTRRRLEPQQSAGRDLEQLDRVAALVQRALGHHQREVLCRVAVEVERAADRLDRPVDGHRQVARGA